MGGIENLRINKIVEIEVKSGNFKGKYPSRIEGIEEDTLTLGTPIKKGYVIPFSIKAPIAVNYMDETAVYSFDTVVIDQNIDQLPLLVVKKPDNVIRIQRRNYVRWEVKLPMIYSIMGKDFEEYVASYQTKTIDISGGGLRFATGHKIAQDDALNIQIELPETGIISAIGQVVRVEKIVENNQAAYLCSVSFDILDKKDQDKIVQFIFEQQRKLRAKGLL